MALKRTNSPFIPCEGVPQHIRRTNWDKDYITYEIKDIVVKTGEGEEDYVLKRKIIEHRDNIAEVIAKDADSVGVANLIERVLRTGDQSLMPQPFPFEGQVADATGVPDNLLDADNMAKEAELKYMSLPEELRKGRSLAEFAESVTGDEFMAYINSITPKQTEEKGDDK